MIMMRTILLKLFLITTLIVASATASFAHTTSFTYQGRLVTEGSPADGLFEFQFKLFDAQTDGNQIGEATVPQTIQVTNGVFVAQLDFGPGAFNGPNRFLEISVGPAGGQRTMLAPRQPITSTPYSVKSLSAAVADGLSVTCVSCVTSSQIASVSGSAVSGAIPVASVPAGSGSYIQNTTTQQAASDFNISGSGSANVFNAATQYNIGGNRILSAPGTSTFVGVGAGGFNNGASNTFIGSNAGQNNLGFQNTFVGEGTGSLNPFKPGLTLIGAFASAGGEAFYSTAIGWRASVDQMDSLVLGGIEGVNGGRDTKVGIGITAPQFKLHVIDRSNTGLRVQTDAPGGTVASFGGLGEFQIDAPGVGAGRFIVKEDGKVGIGTSAPASRLHLAGNSANFALTFTNAANTVGRRGYRLAFDNDRLTFQRANDSGFFAESHVAILQETGFLGVGTVTPSDQLQVVGDIRVGTAGSNGCLKSFGGGGITGTCSSDLRLKQQITPFAATLDRLVRLRPVHFYWRWEEYPDRRFGREQSFGLIAQEVEDVMPELVAEDEKGFKAVNYSKLPVLTLQAIKELKAENDALKKEINQMRQQQSQVEMLKKAVCQLNPKADVCK